ncbi:MAG: TonB-dependent receptor plug domain-containing protein [Saprospiraceae bacterium]|nr:TonB-dependent receptor plug domain-containing protein [Saprospiraceae bacterium]
MSGQYRILGFVYDAAEEPYAGVEVQLKGDSVRATTYTDPEGRFEFHDVRRGDYTVLVITGYGLIERDISVRTSLEMHLQRARNIKTDEVVVHAVRAQGRAPIPQDNIDKEEIRRRNLGQDVPYLLKWSPSVVTTSDAGTGIGYTGMRIRGTDPTRVNVTINGIPLNDAESQAVFWVDLPDLLSSTQSIQIQRGVGASTFGTGAFGASVNLNTIETHIDPYARVTGTIGSFGTRKANLQVGSGLLNNHWTIDSRVSTIQSDGYIDRGTADLRSFYVSAAYLGAKNSLRFIAFGGNEVTYQAWNGVPAQYINDPVLRTFNTAGTERPGAPYDNEVDDYTQTHYQLHWNASVFTQIQTFVSLNYTRGKGYFEQYKSVAGSDGFFTDFLERNGIGGADAVRRRWLDNDFYGAIGGIHYQDPTGRYEFRLGGGLHRYLGDHFGEVIWSATGTPVDALPRYYENDAVKRDRTLFAKLNYLLGERWALNLDLQTRSVKYEFEGLDNDGSPLTQTANHRFFNPKAGLSYTLGESASLHYFTGIANREPNRDDYVESTPSSRPSPERLFDHELGLRLQRSKWQLNLNAFAMLYKDHLILTGRINDVGEYTRVNVDRSRRLGLELETVIRPVDRLEFTAAVTLSRNQVEDFAEYIDNWDYWNQDFENTPPEELEPQQFVAEYDAATDLAFSPEVTGHAALRVQLLDKAKHQLHLTWMTKYVGDQYLDNTSRAASLLEGYTFTDLGLNYQFQWSGQRTVEVHALVRNLFDAAFESNGWIYRFRSRDYDPRPDDPYAVLEGGDLYHLKGLFPQAGRNVLVGLTISI